jgi:predicted transcriptional regulator
MTDVTFSVRLPQETKALLDSLSKSTNRSKNFLAREAITSFVNSEAEIVEGIKQGLEDVRNYGDTPFNRTIKPQSHANFVGIPICNRLQHPMRLRGGAVCNHRNCLYGPFVLVCVHHSPHEVRQ